METVYTPRKEKHFTPDEMLIRMVINCKITQWMELQEQDEHPPERSAIDELLGRNEFPSEKNLEAAINLLSDENLSDILLLAAMGETLDVNMDLNPGEERFLDFYMRHPEMVENDRYCSWHAIKDKKYISAAIRLGQILMELPKGTDIGGFSAQPLDWTESQTDTSLRRLISRSKACQKKEEKESDGE